MRHHRIETQDSGSPRFPRLAVVAWLARCCLSTRTSSGSPVRPACFLTALITPVMVVALSLGAVAHGYAQVRPGPAPNGLTSVVICGDGEMQTILLDETGTPIAPEHCLREMCAACLTTVTHAAVDPFEGVAAPLDTGCLAFSAIAFDMPILRPAVAPRPRGPPVSSHLT